MKRRRATRADKTGPTLFDDLERADTLSVLQDIGCAAFPARPYQRNIVDGCVQKLIHQKFNSVLAVAATGLGKTVVAGYLSREWLTNYSALFQSGRRVLFIAHREELLSQAEKTLKAICPRAVIQTDRADKVVQIRDSGEPYCEIVLASVQTLSQAHRLYRYARDAFSLIFVDEAHHLVTKNKMYYVILDYFGERAKVVGITATPDRSDGRALGQYFESALDDVYSMEWGIDQGYLVPLVVESPIIKGLDLDGLGTGQDGDLDAVALGKVMCEEKFLHELADPLVKLANKPNKWFDGRPRPTLVFAASVEHSRLLADILNRHHDRDRTGIACHVDCERTSTDERQEINRRFRAGEITYLCNYNIFSEGTDFPEVRIVVLARKTNQRATMEQMIGRGCRPHPGVVEAINQATTPEERRALIAGSLKPGVLIIDPIANTGEHKLKTPVDVLGGWYDDDVATMLAASVRAKGGRANINAELKAARLEKERLEAQRRKKVVVRADFSMRRIDPFNVLDMATTREPGWFKGRRPSEPMLAILRKNRFPESFLEEVTYGQARTLIDEIIRRSKLGLCTFSQARLLVKYGYDGNVTFDEARDIIDRLAASGWQQGEDHAGEQSSS